MQTKSPKYRILSFTTSNKRDKRQWFSLEIQLHTTRFRIAVSPLHFCNSPVRSAEFQKYFALLLFEHDGGHDDSIEETDEETTSTALLDCFDWATGPCLADFERLSPAPPPLKSRQLTLSDFLVTASFECNLTATDEILAPAEIERIETDEDCWPSSSSNSESRDGWTTSFPSFSPAEVTVICDDPDHPFDSNPTHVRIGQQRLYFKQSLDPDDAVAKKEVETYEKIARADLGAGARTSRLFGVVRNARSQLLGLLLYPIEEDTLLTFAVGPDTPNALKDRWARQVRDTLAALHRAGCTWGDAKPDNVLIDVHGDAWIVDFGGGRTEGWVDSGKPGTVEGDLQGLERIMEFIASGGAGRVDYSEEY
ncbi:hypothetical protein C8A03DRAFT_17994 [Achaetomium macrosporum]|uniref:Protein kinase domain-containing protein n=1 Tax=Achaetomium macrosporum TaxID=79813 RepID=A0AAN7H4Z7_9PEZI|nr:hypothetical protein C8A03DRAFT_17994 [Achaetomium macrosporum]